LTVIIEFSAAKSLAEGRAADGFMPFAFFDMAFQKRKAGKRESGNARRKNGPDAGARPGMPGAGVVPQARKEWREKRAWKKLKI